LIKVTTTTIIKKQECTHSTLQQNLPLAAEATATIEIEENFCYKFVFFNIKLRLLPVRSLVVFVNGQKEKLNYNSLSLLLCLRYEKLNCELGKLKIPK